MMLKRGNINSNFVYIYRDTISNEGGSEKILKDLILLLDSQGYSIGLIYRYCFNDSIGLREDGSFIPMVHFNIPENEFWQERCLNHLNEHIDLNDSPVLFSFLDFDCFHFLKICKSILTEDMFWLNLGTNHPSLIRNRFDSDHSHLGVDYHSFCKSMNVIRLENENFSQYFEEDLQKNILSFYNTVDVKKNQKLSLPKRFNLLSVNGLRETRKSIMPFVEIIPKILDHSQKFHLYIIGTQVESTKRQCQKFINNQGLHNYITIIDYVDNIEDFYGSMDAMITTAEYEGTSNAVIESICYDLPVFSLENSIGINETVIDGKTGHLLKDVLDFRELILYYINNPEDHKKLKLSCSLEKSKFLDKTNGINRYLDAINNKDSYISDLDYRKKIIDYSASLSTGKKYRKKLDALILYLDLDNYTRHNFDNIQKSDAYKEACHVYIIAKYSSIEKMENLSSEPVFSDPKVEVLFQYQSIPLEYSHFFKESNTSEGLLILNSVPEVQEKLRKNSIFNVIYYNCTAETVWWLKQSMDYLHALHDWQKKDTWLWMLGTREETPNNCVFDIEPWYNFKASDMLNRHNIIIDKNFCLPNFIMRNIRKIY